MAEIELQKKFEYSYNKRGSGKFSVGEAVEEECIAAWDNDPDSTRTNGDRAMESVERTTMMLADLIALLVEKDIIVPDELLSLLGQVSWKIVE